jgi:hypothetical protein
MYFPGKISHFLENGGIWMINHHIFKVFQRQNYKMRLKQRLKQTSLDWINSMQVKKILFTNLFFLIIMLVKYASIDGISRAFLSFRFVDIIVITVHDRFWNVGQAHCPSVFMFSMNIQNDVICLVLRQNCKSKQVTDFIAWLSRCHNTIYKFF